MKKVYCIFLMLLSSSVFAQPDPVFTQYVYNQFVINPAYAGSRNAMSAVLTHRSRWTGIDGSPTTQTLSVHSNAGSSGFAWGVNLAHDQLGPNTIVNAAATGAYHVKFKRGKLSFGLRGGLYNSRLNTSKFDFKDQTDPLNNGANLVANRFNFDAGVYYYTRRFFVGLSLNHLNAGRLNYSDDLQANFFLRRYNTLAAGYAFQLNDNFILKPSLLLKNTPAFDTNLDINLGLLMYDRIWLGVGFRNQTSMNFLLDINVTDFFRIGYSYDAFLNSLSIASNGVHEIFVGFDFTTDKSQNVSPRYF